MVVNLNTNQRNIYIFSIFIIIITILSMLIIKSFIQIPNNNPDPIPGVHYGNVYGEFKPTGIVTSIEEYRDEKFSLDIYRGKENSPSNFSLEVWNISEIQIGNHDDGVFSYNNYTLDNTTVIIEGDDINFFSFFQHGTVEIEYSEVSIANQEEIYDFKYNFSSLRGNAVLGHRSGPHLDFQIWQAYVRINNETFYLQAGKFGFPENETANIKFTGKGRGLISPIPAFLVNGTVVITDFRELDANGRSMTNHDRYEISSTNLRVITQQVPVSDVNRQSKWFIVQPWSVEIRDNSIK